MAAHSDVPLYCHFGFAVPEIFDSIAFPDVKRALSLQCNQKL